MSKITQPKRHRGWASVKINNDIVPSAPGDLRAGLTFVGIANTCFGRLGLSRSNMIMIIPRCGHTPTARGTAKFLRTRVSV